MRPELTGRDDAVVLGLARGGVPVAAAVADGLVDPAGRAGGAQDRPAFATGAGDGCRRRIRWGGGGRAQRAGPRPNGRACKGFRRRLHPRDPRPARAGQPATAAAGQPCRWPASSSSSSTTGSPRGRACGRPSPRYALKAPARSSSPSRWAPQTRARHWALKPMRSSAPGPLSRSTRWARPMRTSIPRRDEEVDPGAGGPREAPAGVIC